MRRIATATMVGVFALSQSVHSAGAYPQNAEEMAAAQAGLDATNADALVYKMVDYLRQQLSAPLDRRNFALRPGRDRIVPVSVSLASRNSRIGNSIAIEALRLDIGALILAGTGSRAAGTANQKLFSLVIEGKEHLLGVSEVIFDPVFDMQHVLAAVVNAGPDTYARFTFDPESGSLAGTVETGIRKYRIVSSNDSGVQLVFRLGSAPTGTGDLITSRKLVAAPVADVERRHAQAERIAAIKPEYFVYPKNGFTTSITGGSIGKVDVARLGEPGVIASLLKELAVFTGATGDEDFQIIRMTP